MSYAISSHELKSGGRWGIVPFLVALFMVGTIWLRYANPWAENDTAVLTRASRAILDEGTVTPDQFAYDHGFAYPSLVATVSAVTGASITDVQLTLLPWLTVFTALVAFIAFRSITRSGRAGAIAACMLLVQPDFLFVSQRGSHEKTTWTFVLTLLYCLATSLEGRRLRQSVPYVIAFYIAGFAMLTTNAFFGSSFTTIILLSLTGAVIITRRLFRIGASRRLIPRLGYVFLILTALTYLVLFYLYAPAGNNVASFARVVDRLSALYLNVDTSVEQRVTETSEFRSSARVSRSTTTASPYASVSNSWISTPTFVMLTLFTWLLLIAAFLIWLLLAVTFVRRGVARSELPQFLMWAFTAAAGAQIALSVSADFAGALGSNLQLRLFPVFNVFAIPMVVTAVAQYQIPHRSKVLRYAAIGIGVSVPIAAAVAYPPATILIAAVFGVILYVATNWRKSIWARRVVVAAGVLAFTYFATASILKSTNDPLVSNKWGFYGDGERRAILWSNRYVPNQFVWADFDERIKAASVLELNDSDPRSAFWTTSSSTAVRLVMNSEEIEERAKRLRDSLPSIEGSDMIYDNGSAQIHHVVPQSPYQP